MDSQKQKRIIESLSLTGIILAFLWPPIGFIISVIAWAKARANPAYSKQLAVAGAIIGAVLTIIPLVLFPWLFISFGGSKDNQAETNFKPIAHQIAAMGGQKICSNGDSGEGIDNTVPWYQVYYTLADTPELTSKISSIAADQGYILSENNDLKKDLQDKNALFGDEGPSPYSEYLISKNGKTSLEINVNRKTSVRLYCGVSDYGKKRATGNDAIVDLKLTLPAVER